MTSVQSFYRLNGKDTWMVTLKGGLLIGYAEDVSFFVPQICWRLQLWETCKYGCWIHSLAFSTNLQWRGIPWASQEAVDQISFQWTVKSWYLISGKSNILLETNDSVSN